MKKFFFNKVEINKITSFSDLITSFALGGVKIFILLLLNAIFSSLFFGIESEYRIITSILSVIITLLILIYILINRIPNQFRIIKNYLNTNKHKNSEVSKVMITEKTTNSENLNFDNFKERIYFKNSKKDVHYTFEQLKIKGNLYTTDLIWFEGLKNWTKVNEINELSYIALSKPPLTEKEKNILCFKNSLKPSIIFYTIFSVALGIFAGLLEKNQYESFFKETNANEIKNDKEDIQRFGYDYKTNPNLNSGGFSYVRNNEIYVTREDGTQFTRWSSYLVGRGIDQEQVSYNENHKFLFRPYKAIIKHANLI